MVWALNMHIDRFSVLYPLCHFPGIHQHRGKGLAAFLKSIGYIIPLMDSEYANYYTREVMDILIREVRILSAAHHSLGWPHGGKLAGSQEENFSVLFQLVMGSVGGCYLD